MSRTKTNWDVVRMLQQNAANINCKGHFALAENAKVEIAKVRRTRPETDDFWASSYYCGTAGHVSAEQVARYIRENTEKY